MAHTNFMGGISYHPGNPLKKLELELCSCFLQEPRFYPASDVYKEVIRRPNDNYILFPENTNKTWQKIFEEDVNEALSYDFAATLCLAVKARKEFHMRNAPCHLLAIAASHPLRQKFNHERPFYFRQKIQEVCLIVPDMVNILDAWKLLHGSTSSFPSFCKRSFADIIQKTSPYHANKYRKAYIDIVRLCHPRKTSLTEEMMQKGKIAMEEKDLPWNTLMSRCGSWSKTLDMMEWNMPHMAALRNIRGFAIQVRNEELIQKYCTMLENGVPTGKQFPFRYWTAYLSLTNSKSLKNVRYRKRIRKSDLTMLKNCLASCIQISIQNHPRLEGSVIVLSDNSGSAWGQFTSQYGTMTVAEIGNLSALITAYSCTGKGIVGLFGDTLLEYTVDKSITLLENLEKMQGLIGPRGQNVGHATEEGIWIFFKRAMESPVEYRYDHFFCYSDMQAGHGRLFGYDPEMGDEWTWENIGQQKFIHVPKLVENYRQTINPKLNVFTVQTAGYNDSILPQCTYRGGYLHGWTGNEVVYAEKMISLWDEFDSL
jgi:hypothetical protein